MADSGDGFVSRWARRKQARQSEPGEPDKAPVAPGGEEGREPVPQDAAASEELVAGLPDIETLTEESDFTVFLQEGVPEALRRRALRRLWRLNPVFANLDGLAEYDEDYTLATSALQGAVKTIYKVGKGMVEPDEPEAALETADDSASTDESETAETSAREPAAEPPAEEAPAAALADKGETAGTVGIVPEVTEAEVPVPRSESVAAARRWGRFKS